MDILKESKDSRNTLELLKCISSHLAGREDCKDIEYEVKIRRNMVQMYPVIYVYPSIHERKKCHKAAVHEHVLSYHILADAMFIDGDYVYSHQGTSNRRHWTRKS